MKNAILLVLLGMGLTACSEGKLSTYAHRERVTAPQTETQMGLLVNKASEKDLAKLLEAESHAQFRTLNAQHGLYEVYGVSEEKIREYLEKVQISRNDFIPLEHGQPRLLDEEGSIPGFESCVRNDESPLAVIKYNGDPADGLVLEIGQSLKFSSSESMAHPAHASGLRYAWAIQAPSRSAFNETIQTTDDLEIKPDAMGLYQILLIVQDKRGVCAAEIANIVITANAAFKAPTEPTTELDLKSFTHLDTIHAKESWEISQGEGVTIAIIDSGVNYNHPLLAPNIRINRNEIADNGIDDDENGFVDDVYGYDFANKDAFPYDDEGHGTHVAGLAAGLGFGMAQKAKILPVKAMGPIGGDIGSIVAAIYYSVDQGAQVINMSFGNYGKAHPKLLEALDYAEEKNVTVTAASGNGNPINGAPVNTDQIPNFPSAAKNENIIAVAASSKGNILAEYSNFGLKSVDIVLPGGNTPDDPIVSCAYENPQGEFLQNMSGTSMAAPIASGLVAQILSLNPKLTPKEVKEILMSTGTVKKELKALIGSGRHADAEQALLKAKGATSQLLM